MTKLSAKTKKISLALTAVSNAVYHYRRPASLDGAVLWAEDSEDGSFKSDNHLAEQVIHATVDYFTKTEYDQKADDIQTALDSIQTGAWRLNSISYEDDTGLIHFEWEVWTV